MDDLEETSYGRRANCRRCEVKVPRMMDVACGNWGVIGEDAGKATFMEVCSESWASLMEKAVAGWAIVVKQPSAK